MLFNKLFKCITRDIFEDSWDNKCFAIKPLGFTIALDCAEQVSIINGKWIRTIFFHNFCLFLRKFTSWLISFWTFTFFTLRFACFCVTNLILLFLSFTLFVNFASFYIKFFFFFSKLTAGIFFKGSFSFINLCFRLWLNNGVIIRFFIDYSLSFRSPSIHISRNANFIIWTSSLYFSVSLFFVCSHSFLWLHRLYWFFV